MIRRSMDAARFHELANDPSIRPFIGVGDEPYPIERFRALIDNPATIAIEAPHGGWMLVPILLGVYELHTMFLRKGRGRSYFTAAAEALRYVFAATDALEVVTKCPDNNNGARWAASKVGFRERFRREDAWQEGVGISYRVLSIDDWCNSDPATRRAGQKFHAALEAAKLAKGSELAAHPDDEAHDRTVGAAMLMCQAGNVGKGIAYYNRWAAFAGYAEIEQVGVNLVDVRDAVLEIKDGQMVVVHCR